MDQHGNTHGLGNMSNSSNQIPYPVNPYQPNPITSHSQAALTGSTQPLQPTNNLSASSSSQIGHQHQLAYQQIHQQQQQQLQHAFWSKQYEEIDQVMDFKNHGLPLARIKKIMKADEDVRMISAEAPVIFARACEMFILELTVRAWNHTEENKRRTLQKNDIAAAITRTDIFDFLVDIVPREDLKDEVLASLPRDGGVGGVLPVGGPSEGLPYYYMPPPPPQNMPSMGGAPGGMFVGKPVDPTSVYGQQARSAPYMMPQMWPQQPPQPPPEDNS